MSINTISQNIEKNIYIKRDDETGIELSGNKVSKLEFAAAEAKSQAATVLITCGGTIKPCNSYRGHRCKAKHEVSTGS